ncbi:GNAT family N-acetyltransferase [bacterium]|nr:GNAT family N-acetyltransferase [bacterium]
MSTHCKIRTAAESDVPLVFELVRDLAEFEHMTDECVATEQDIHNLLFGTGAVAEAVIADFDGQAAGFALFLHNCSTFAGKKVIYLEDLFVRPALRGKGIGKALLLHVIDLAKERDCARVEWHALKWNTRAIEFYKSIGAVPRDDWMWFHMLLQGSW